MYSTEVYDRVYFQDDYKQQFDALRSRYHDRTQKALAKRAVDHKPTPNATTIIYLHDEPDGGVTISSGDFVEYFNRRYGGKDRIGTVRASLANAAQKAEKSREYVKMQKSEQARAEGGAISCRTRMSRAHTLLVNAVFALLFILSVGLLSVSGVMLERSEAQVMAAEEAAEATSAYETVTMYAEGDTPVSGAYLNCPAEDQTQVFDAEEEKNGFDALRCALTYLWS